MRFFASFLLTAAVAAGCGETAASMSPDDAGSDASTDPDGGVDGGDLDGGVDGGEPDGGGSWCKTGGICPACPDPDALCESDIDCDPGEVCITTGCEDLSRCFVSGGGACQDDDDCGNPAYMCNQEINRCLRVGGGCDDSNDCLAGFACEGGACADRRVPCVSGADCPHGFTCFFPSADQRFCRRITRPCDNDVDCLTLGVLPCGDADGDRSRECMPSRMPNAPNPVSCDNVECILDAAPVCETSVEGLSAVCGQFGLCASSDDCANDRFDCLDLWGDGRKECVLRDGSCGDSRDCTPPQLCGSPRTGGPPRCISGAAI